MIACIAVGAIVGRRSLLPLAALFGVADGVGFLIGSALSWQISSNVSAVLKTGILVALGLYLLVVSTFTGRVAARWPVWVLPWALSIDNLTYGLVGDDHAAGSLLEQAGQQALSSGLLALAGLLVGVMVGVLLPRMLPVMQRRAVVSGVAGSALILGAGVMLLAG